MRRLRGIEIQVLGDSGPFSKLGASVSFLVKYGSSEYLIDCGAPIFRDLGVDGIRRLKGIIGTHSHEDHKRWFTDLALFMRYEMVPPKKLRLIATEVTQEEFQKNSRAALERTLSDDSKRIIEVPYDAFVESVVFGPRARFRVGPCSVGDGYDWRVVDEEGRIVPPTRAKVVVRHPAKEDRPRMLFRDEQTGAWVEPETFYSFSSKRFYQDADNPHVDETGLVLRPLKAISWHGPSSTGVHIAGDTERIAYSSDTVYDPDLWKSLTRERRPQRLGGMSREEFEKAHVIVGDINDFIEIAWSEDRYVEALSTYKDAVVFHDVAGKDCVVHTRYSKVASVAAPVLILTHCPDTFVSEKPLTMVGKRFEVVGKEVFELVGNSRRRLTADLYLKTDGAPYVGYRNPRGRYKVVEKDGFLAVARRNRAIPGELRMFVEIYRDVGGRYVPETSRRSEEYKLRLDGKVELVTTTKSGSKGRVVEDLRPKLEKRAQRGSGNS